MLVGRAGLSPVLVGRDAPMKQLRDLAARPGPAVAVIGGEAGLGKSRMVRELLAPLPDDVLVLAGQADPGSLGRPFELFIDALSEHVANDDPRVAALRLSGDAQAPLSERVAAAVDLALDVIGDQRAAVVFDDLHWADSESIDVFERLAATGADLLLVGTYRPSEITRRHPLAEALPRLERRPAMVHLRLEPLTIDDVGAFLSAVYGGTAPYRIAESLHTRTGGSPFFLEELLTAARGASVEELASLPLPWNLAELVRGQVDELDPVQRRVIETAAVLGRRVSFDVLAAVTNLPEAELIVVLRALIDHGLLIEGDPDVFRFRHDLTREAIGDRPLGRERRLMHQAALDALRASGTHDLAAMAHHALGAGRFDELVDLAREGTRHYLAIGSTHQALRLAELGLSEAPTDLELRGAAVRAAWLVGLLEEAIEHALRLESDAEAVGDRIHRSEARRMLVRLAFELERADLRRDTVAALVADLDLPADDPALAVERAEVLGALTQEAMLDGRTDDTIRWADLAIAAADACDLPRVRMGAEVERAVALLESRHDVVANVELLDRLATEAVAAGDDVLASRTWHNLSSAGAGLISNAERLSMLTRQRAAASRAGWDSQAAQTYCGGRFEIALDEGDMAGAWQWLDEAGTARVGDRCSQSWLELREIELLCEVGDADRAAARLAGLSQPAEEKVEYLQALRVVVAATSGRVAGARAQLSPLADKAAHGDGLDAISLQLLVPRTLDLGLTAAELRPLVDAIQRYSGRASSLSTLAGNRLQAHLTLADGDAEDALRQFEATLAVPRNELPVSAADRAIDHIGAARAHLLVRRPDDAATHADAARALLRRWAGWRVDALEALDRRLGRRAGEAIDGPPDLTPREREVLSLVAEGLTNAELAERLFISPRTAGVHVSNILAKLGLSSRTEAAAWSIRAGLDPH